MTNRIVRVILRGEIGDLRGKMVAAGKSVKDTADKMTAAGKESEKFRRGLDDIGSSAGKMGLVAAAGLGAMAVASSNFESAMSNVQAATHESTANMEKLRDAAIEAGRLTAFSATEAAAGIENLAKAGVATADILDGGLDGALALAAAGSIDVAEAAESAATAMTQFGLKGTDVPHIADLLAAAAGKAQGEVSDFNYALAQSGLVANQVGLSIEETTGGLAAFASAGLLGSDAGTSFKTMLGALTPNSDKAKAAMENLGISAFDTQGNFIGLAEFAGKLRDGMKDLSSEQRQAALETIFGSDAVRAASVIYDQGEEGVRKWIAAVDDQGFAAETAAIKMNNLKGDFEALGGSIETVLIGMGSSSQGPLRELVQGLTGAVNAFGALPSAAQGTVTAMLGITAITGGSLWFGAKVVRGVSDTREALANLGTAGEKAGRALKGLGVAGSVVGGLVLLDGALKALRDTMKGDLPETNVLVGQLLDLRDAKVGSLPGEFRDLSGALGDLGQTFSGMERFDVPVLGPLTDMLTWGDTAHEKFSNATDTFAALDEALASLAGSGGAPAAEQAFEALATSQGLSADEQDRLLEQLPGYQEALAGIANDSRLAAGSVTGLSAAALSNGIAIEGMGKASAVAAEQQDKLDAATKEARDAARGQAEAWIGLGAGLDDAEVSLQKWLTSLEEQAKALEDFTDNAKTAADKGLRQGLIDALQDAGPAGALRMKELANASEDEIRRANQAWKRGQDAIKDYVKQEVPPKKPKIDNLEAIRAIDEVIHRLKDIPDGKATINVGWSIKKPPGALAGVIDFDGDGKPDFATGGWTGPGAKYQPAGIVHADEYVFSKEATQGNVAMLDYLHRHLRGYAAGGHVGPSPASMGGLGMGFTVNELADVIMRARPVNWHGTFEDFQKLERDAARRRAVTGPY